MKKAKVGDKFIIEIGSVIKGANTGCNQYIVKGFDKLILDDKGIGILQKYTRDEYDDACKFGAEQAWEIAHAIMEIPIKDRAELFGVSDNKTSFKDLSKRFSIYDAVSVYEAYQQRAEVNRKKEIINNLKKFAEKNGYSMNELKTASKIILREIILREKGNIKQ